MQACCRECTGYEQVIHMVISMKGNKKTINVSIWQVITSYRYECRPRYKAQIVVSGGSVLVLLLCIWGYSQLFVVLTIVYWCVLGCRWLWVFVGVCVQSMSVRVVQMSGGRVQECDSCREEAVLVPGGLSPKAPVVPPRGQEGEECVCWVPQPFSDSSVLARWQHQCSISGALLLHIGRSQVGQLVHLIKVNLGCLPGEGGMNH